MKKHLLFFSSFFLIIGLVFFSGVKQTTSIQVHAQDDQEIDVTDSVDSVDYEELYNNYLASIDEYGRAYSDFVSKKALYDRLSTAKSESEAISSGVVLLKARDDVVIAYLNMLLTRLEQTSGIEDEIVSNVSLKTQQEVGWYEDHKVLVDTVFSINNLNDRAAEMESRLVVSDDIFYTILLNLVYARTQDYQDRLVETHNNLSNKIASMKQEDRGEETFSLEKFTRLDKWMRETQILIDSAQEKRKQVYQDLLSNKIKTDKQYMAGVDTLESSTGYMREALYRILEIIIEIKSKE